jgi:hypothetical protein
LADRYGRAVRVLYSREDVVRLGPKRPPFAGGAVLRDGRMQVAAAFTHGVGPEAFGGLAYGDLRIELGLSTVDVAGPPVATDARAAGRAEAMMLVEGALDAAGYDRAGAVVDERAAHVLLDNALAAGTGARAGARLVIDGATGAIERVEVRVAAGDPLDEIVLRSYAIGAAHMALGWVFTEGLAVDPETGEVHDLTIRSFGIIAARNTPPIDVTIVDDDGPPLARASDVVFCAVAASAWNAVTRADGARPETFPALQTRTARKLRR